MRMGLGWAHVEWILDRRFGLFVWDEVRRYDEAIHEAMHKAMLVFMRRSLCVGVENMLLQDLYMGSVHLCYHALRSRESLRYCRPFYLCS